jgi:hypothetical protein
MKKTSSAFSARAGETQRAAANTIGKNDRMGTMLSKSVG